MAVRIVTDSTADIPLERAKELDITVVPLTVFFEDEPYQDGIELDNAGFYQKLQASKQLPRTSQPAPAAFQEAFQRLIDEGADAILSVHLSSKLSGTYQSACTARDILLSSGTVKSIPIEIVDSQSISAGMSLPIMQAAENARKGQSLEELQAPLLDQLSRSRILAVLDTLEYVRRGGRIGAAQAMVGNMLSVKPIVTLKDGAVAPVEQPRTRSKAYARVAQLISDMGPIEQIAIAEASADVGQQLAQALSTIYQGTLPHYTLGAVLGTHTGPGTAAAIIITAPQ